MSNKSPQTKKKKKRRNNRTVSVIDIVVDSTSKRIRIDAKVTVKELAENEKVANDAIYFWNNSKMEKCKLGSAVKKRGTYFFETVSSEIIVYNFSQ